MALALLARLRPLAVLLAVSAAAGTAAAATVTPFATQLPQSLYGLTSDTQALYFTGATGATRDYGHGPASGLVGRVSLADGSVSTLYTSANYATTSGHVSPMQIATDGTGTLVWADPDAGPGTGAAFLSGSTTGGPVTQFFGTCCGAGVLPGDGIGAAMSDGHIYFSDATGARVGVDPSGSAATQIGPTRYAPDFNTAEYAQIAVANGRIYIADSAQELVADGNGVALRYDRSSSLLPGVRWISLDGSSGFVDLSVGKIDHPRGIVAVGNFLYVTGTKVVWKINATTGHAKAFARDKRFRDLQGITYVNGAFYVADSQTKFGPVVDGVATATKDGLGVIWKILP